MHVASRFRYQTSNREMIRAEGETDTDKPDTNGKRGNENVDAV